MCFFLRLYLFLFPFFIYIFFSFFRAINVRALCEKLLNGSVLFAGILNRSGLNEEMMKRNEMTPTTPLSMGIYRSSNFHLSRKRFIHFPNENRSRSMFNQYFLHKWKIFVYGKVFLRGNCITSLFQLYKIHSGNPL